MNVLVIGDIIGKPGRNAVGEVLPQVKKQNKVDLVIANAENAAGGLGLTPETAKELMRYGVDVLTSGNHIWKRKEIIPSLDGVLPIIRPINYPPGLPGSGYLIRDDVMVANLIGRTFIGNFDCPFRAVDKLLEDIKPLPKIIIIDFHAEATSEKVAFGRYVEGRVSAVVGTHTHVTTADERVLPKGTAYISDIGMVGPIESIIGDDIKAVTERFLTGINNRLPVAKGKVMFNAALIDIDEQTGKAKSIKRIYREVE